MAERKPKRQRLSLGGPAADTSFEDFLTGSTKRVSSSDEEEEIDQENLDPEDEPHAEDNRVNELIMADPYWNSYFDSPDEDEDKKEDHRADDPRPKQRSASVRPALAPAPTPAAVPSEVALSLRKRLVREINMHRSSTNSSTARDIYYLLHARLVLPDEPVAVTRLLRVPAILLFQQLSEALRAAFDIRDDFWRFTLELRPQPSTVAAAETASTSSETPDDSREIANIKDGGFSDTEEGFPGDAYDPTNFQPQDVRLMDIWDETQIPEVRALRVFYTYEAGAYCRYARITFMGVADQNLQAADLGVRVSAGQQIWCVGGSGACVPLELEHKKLEAWKRKTNRHEWDIGLHNAELSKIQVQEV